MRADACCEWRLVASQPMIAHFSNQTIAVLQRMLLPVFAVAGSQRLAEPVRKVTDARHVVVLVSAPVAPPLGPGVGMPSSAAQQPDTSAPAGRTCASRARCLRASTASWRGCWRRAGASRPRPTASPRTCWLSRIRARVRTRAAWHLSAGMAPGCKAYELSCCRLSLLQGASACNHKLHMGLPACVFVFQRHRDMLPLHCAFAQGGLMLLPAAAASLGTVLSHER